MVKGNLPFYWIHVVCAPNCGRMSVVSMNYLPFLHATTILNDLDAAAIRGNWNPVLMFENSSEIFRSLTQNNRKL